MRMNTKGWIIASAALALCVAVVLACGIGTDTTVRVDTAAVAASAEAVIECGLAESYDELQQYLSENAALESTSPGQQEASNRIRAAFFDSVRYEIPQTCYAAGADIAMDIPMESLDVSGLMDALNQEATAAMERLVAEAKKPKTVLKEDGTVREDVRQKVILETLDALLEKEPVRSEWVLTMQFLREDRQWKVVPTKDLLQFLSGMIPG